MLAALRADASALGGIVRRMASLDCLQALAALAASPGYCAPTLLPDEHPATIDIRGGRHPLVAARLAGRGAAFVPNDTALGGSGGDGGGGGDSDGADGGGGGSGGGDGGGGGGGDDGDGSEGGQAGVRCGGDAPRALVLMGPNMGGKSCYARQVGLIVLLAQLGSYVPADACALTPMRALFTRMGAADQLCRGRSTFQNELAEAAEALRNLGPRTLLLLDELGRGTSTHDGATISASNPTPTPTPAPIPAPIPHPNPSLPSPNPDSNPNPDQARPSHTRHSSTWRRGAACSASSSRTTPPSPRSPRRAQPPSACVTWRRYREAARLLPPWRARRARRARRPRRPRRARWLGCRCSRCTASRWALGRAPSRCASARLLVYRQGCSAPLPRRPSGCRGCTSSSGGGNTPRSSCGSRRRSCVPATRRVRTQARKPDCRCCCDCRKTRG